MSANELRLARIGDAQAIAEMSRTLIEAGLPWTWTPRRVLALMRQRENLSVVAMRERDMVGFVMAQFGKDAVHVALLGVAESERRLGLGKQFVRWVEESAIVAGLFHIRLEVRASNKAARRFYAAMGYAESGLAARYYSGVEDAVQLTRDLRVTALKNG